LQLEQQRLVLLVAWLLSVVVQAPLVQVVVALCKFMVELVEQEVAAMWC